MASSGRSLSKEEVLGMIFGGNEQQSEEECGYESSDDDADESGEDNELGNELRNVDEACFRDSLLNDDVDLQSVEMEISEDESDEEYFPEDDISEQFNFANDSEDNSSTEDEVADRLEERGRENEGNRQHAEGDELRGGRGRERGGRGGMGRERGGRGGRGRERGGRGHGGRGRGVRGRRGRGRGGRGRGDARGGQRRNADNQRNWAKFAGPQPDVNPNANVGFFEACGPSRLIRYLQHPIEFFMIFVTRDLIKTFVDQTNLYCRQSNGGNPPVGRNISFPGCNYCNGIGEITKFR